MKYFLFSLVLLVGLLLESTIINFPFVLIILLIGNIIWEDAAILVVGCLGGFLLDSIGFRLLGSSALFFLCMLLLIFLYRQKFEIKTLTFVVGMTALSSLVYTILFSYQKVWLQVIVSCVVAGVIFVIYSLTQRNEKTI